MHETTKRLLWAIGNYHGTASSMELVAMARDAWCRAGRPDLPPLPRGMVDSDAIANAIRTEDDRHLAEAELARRRR